MARGSPAWILMDLLLELRYLHQEEHFYQIRSRNATPSYFTQNLVGGDSVGWDGLGISQFFANKGT